MLSAAERATTSRAIDALAAMDLDALVAEYHPEVELVTLSEAPDAQGTFRGPEAAREALLDIFQVMDQVKVEVRESVEMDGRVLCLAHLSAVGTSSGAPMQTPVAWTWWFRDGKIGRVVFHRDWSEGRRSAEGPSE